MLRARRKKSNASDASSPTPPGTPSSGSTVDSELSKKLQDATLTASSQAYNPTASRTDLPGGYTYLRHMSSPETGVWYNVGEQRVIVAFRGTAGGRDVGTDITAIVLNQHRHHPRYIRSYRQVRRVQKAFPQSSVILTGHSLGGHLATAVGQELQRKRAGPELVHTYNRGSFFWDIGRKRLKQEVETRSYFDPISWTSRYRRGGKLVEKNRKFHLSPLVHHRLGSLR